MDFLREVIGNATPGTVFGTPVTKDDVTLLPVARISAGGGGGSGTEPDQDGANSGGIGGGMGLKSKAMGVYVISGGKVSWRPVVDVNKVIMGGQIIAGIALLTLRAYLKMRKRMRAG
ncbi:MAG: sporulation protein [Longispora sp.]|nr:sporulation protein [Longispora sp. (in: high G+C Gram-positive bacteria)]